METGGQPHHLVRARAIRRQRRCGRLQTVRGLGSVAGGGGGRDRSEYWYCLLHDPDGGRVLRDNLNPREQERSKRRFDSLSARQQGQKGTLLYDAGETLHKCYFEDFRHGITCATTGAFRVLGQDYDSLLDYYRKRHPEMGVKPDEPVAYVSFGNIDRPRPVAANKLRLRVSNESLPTRLKQVDKIPPEKRRSYAEGFWERLGEEPLGTKRPQVVANFWRPKSDWLLQIQPPELLFGDNQSLPAPPNGSPKKRKDHFRERSRLLERAGCFAVPLMVTRVVHVAVPKRIGEATGARLAEDFADRLSSWTRKPVRCELMMYEDAADAVSQLRAEPDAGVVIFVMDDDSPEIYFDIAYELKGWRVKRITGDRLVGMFSKLELDAHDGRASQNGKNGRAPSARHWDSFVEKSALEVLQYMDCVPYVPAEGFNYEAQFAIDVGHDRRFFSLSLLVRRQDSLKPQFRLETTAKSKPDHKQEAINDVILRDEIVALFKRLRMSGHAPLRSVLILRDGRVCGREMEGIKAARQVLVDSGLLEDGAPVAVVDFHKSSAMRIRLWDRDRNGEDRHAFEGTAVLLDERTAVLTNTGAATLRQGTAEPVVLVAHGDGVDMRAVLEDVHVATHMNWSNPDVAQRLPLSLKRTDEELKNRAAQEVRRVSTR